jgi:NAD(P)-dependent dehydrogenase (short-subunit alcohol dehydrogenase family)
MTNLVKVSQDGTVESQAGKVWFITGASSGFGRLLAEYLCELGATVIVTARDVSKIQDFTLKYPGNSFILPLDVTKPDSIAHAVADAIAHAGHVDVLVNNAGYGVTGAVEEVSEEEYMPMFETNVFGLIRLTQALLPQFRERRSGSIVNLSSIGGLIGSPGWGFYNATKFAVEGFSEALAGEMAPLGVNVTAVEPGPFRTDFLGRSGVLSKRVIPDYQQTAGKSREYFQTAAGKQPGDPQRGVEAIVAAVNSPEPPRHLLLGKIALKRWRERLEGWSAELNAWEDTTVGADFPDAENQAPVAPYAEPVRA